MHHLESQRTGGDASNNLIPLCRTAHQAYHRGEIGLKAKRGQSYKEAAFTGVVRTRLLQRLKATHPELKLSSLTAI